MLSERVLEELIRHGDLSQALSTALWPDLSVESKLQLLTAHQTGYSPSTPDYLVDLGLDDESPVVQYFALRHTYLRSTRTDVAENVKSFFVASPEDAARHAKAHSIEHPLVKAAAAPFRAFSAKESLEAMPHLERLVAVRNESQLSLGGLMEFLLDALGKIEDGELAALAYEYFQRPDVQAELKRDKFDCYDGEAAYFAGEGGRLGWEVVRKSSRMLANVLVPHLPTSLGVGTVEAKDLATMPEHVLELLAYDNRDRKEVRELHQMMREQPNNFPEKAIKALDQSSEYPPNDAAVRQRQQRLESPLAERSTLEVVVELQQQVANLAEQLQEMRAQTPKSGFFG
jgi:hypothetical protein